MFDVITIGTATRDVFVASPLFKVVRDKKHLKNLGFISGEATCFALGSKIEVGEPIFSNGGGAANAATTFARQGLKTGAIIKIGNDDSGRIITKKMEKEGIKTFPAIDKKLATASSIILLSPDGERTILVYRGAAEKFSQSDISFDKFDAKWVYISSGKIPWDVMKKIVDHFHKKKTLIALNPSKNLIEMGLKKISPLLAKTRVFILNREEAAYLTGIDYDDKKKIFSALDKAVGGVFVMTDGRDGTWISDNHKIYMAKNFESKPIDETGAGDAFGSGFIAGIIKKKEACRKGVCNWDNIHYAIRLASANAASSVEKVGAQEGILTADEFEKNKRWRNLEIKVIKNGN